jgi:pre-mRNA-processing factor 17
VATGAANRLLRVWKGKTIGLKIKLTFYKSLVLTILLHGAESWPVTQKHVQRLEVFQQRWLRRILKTSWTQHISNEDILQRAGVPSIETRIRQLRMIWLGHVIRLGPARLPYQALFGQLAGQRSRGTGEIQTLGKIYHADMLALQGGTTNGLPWLECTMNSLAWRAFVLGAAAPLSAAVHSSSKGAAGDDKPSNSSRKKQKVDNSNREKPVSDPSAPYALQSRQPWAGKEAAIAELTEEQREMIESAKEAKAEKAAAGEGSKAGVTTTANGDHTIFHGQEEKDYQGRSWLEPSPAAAALTESESCFLPKRHIHTWSGHTKGVNALRFFPKTGHLLLSAGLDGKAKVWDVAGDKRCMRTYLGHSKGIRDTWFFPDGRKFATAAYDKVIKLWDTETGAVLGSFGQGQMAYTVRCHPDPGEPHVLMAGMQNKKILQFDVRTGDVVQEYDYHLAAVNSITFIDENRRFISTSDDKSIRVWEFGIPVQVKYIADPSMHAISTAAVTPNGKWWLGQSADNQIVTYSANDRVKQNRKKVFKGHVGAGYACQVGVSHDERYVFSGDGEGKLFIWDWKSTKIVRSLKAHEGGPCVGAEWHPLETSKVATCGWDGLIKYWD